MKTTRRKISVVFRLDDPSPNSNHELEKSILEILRARGASMTVAVVPFKNTKDGLMELRAGDQLRHLEVAAAEGLVEVALHGCYHTMNTQAGHWGPSEFHGLPYAQQRELMERGLTWLRQVFPSPINGFVPPWNTFDGTTMRVAAELGLQYISAGWNVPPDCPTGPVLIPKTCYLGTLLAAVERARLYRIVSPSIVAIFHPYDFYESGEPEACISLAEFDALLAWVRRQDDLEVIDLQTLSRRLEGRRLLAMFRRAEWATEFHYRLARRWPTEFIHASSITSQLVALVCAGLRAAFGRPL